MPVASIRAAFAQAKSPESPGGAALTKAEIQGVVRDARDGGLTKPEKRALHAGQQGAEKTPAAKAEYARLATKYGFAKAADRDVGSSGSSGGSSGGGAIGSSSPSSSWGGSIGGGSFSGGSIGGGS